MSMQLEMRSQQRMTIAQRFEQSPVQTMLPYGGVELLGNLGDAYERQVYIPHRERMMQDPDNPHFRVAVSLSGGGKKYTLMPEEWLLRNDRYFQAFLKKQNYVLDTVFIPFAHVALAAQLKGIVPRSTEMINPATGEHFGPGHYPYNLYAVGTVNGYELIENFMHVLIHNQALAHPSEVEGKKVLRRVVIEPSAWTVLYGLDAQREPKYGQNDRGVRAVQNILYTPDLGHNLFVNCLTVDPFQQKISVRNRAEYLAMISEGPQDSKMVADTLGRQKIVMRDATVGNTISRLRKISDGLINDQNTGRIGRRLSFDNAPPATVAVSNRDFIALIHQLSANGLLQINDYGLLEQNMINAADQESVYALFKRSFVAKGMPEQQFSIMRNSYYSGDISWFAALEDEINLVTRLHPEVNALRNGE